MLNHVPAYLYGFYGMEMLSAFWQAAFTVIFALSFYIERIFCRLCIKDFAENHLQHGKFQ